MTTNKDTEDNEKTASIQFHEMGLDDRVLKAIAKLGWVEPSLIQEKAIPLFLDGKDVLIKARTGSGKTGAFAIPVIQKILTIKEVSPDDQKIRVLVLAPTKELCTQIFKTILQLTTKCSRDVKAVDISSQVDVSTQKPLLVDLPDVVVATPGRAVLHIKAGTLSLKDLKMLVIDEADLMFSCGYEDDVKQVIKHLPKIYQAALASATLSEDVVSLKKLVLHNAVTLKLQESELAPLKQLTHYKYYSEPIDKPAVLYTLLKLGLIRGKSIIFVNSVDKCYRLKLFLEQFKISSCLLNSELPAGSRCHAVAQFNQGTYDIIIASDESFLDDPSTDSKRNKDKDFGVSRGIDFQFVSNIINYDFPSSINSYIHRAGRTARGSNQGTVLSFVSVLEVPYMEGVDDYLKESLGSKESIFKLYTFKMDEMEGFRYRAKDAWKACTKALIREIRLKEIKQEVLNSQKLKGYFDENPKDLKTLRHDRKVKPPKTGNHLANVPDYLVPSSLKSVSGLVKIKKPKRKFKPVDMANQKYEAKRKNPLVSMDLSEFDDVMRTKKRKS